MSVAREIRERREVVAATAILVSVLLLIDAAALQEPVLALSLLPFAFLVGAALLPLSPKGVAVWIGGIALVAVAMGDPRYVGLSIPAVIMGLLILFHRRGRMPA